MIDSLSIAVHAFVSRVSMSFSVDETLHLPRKRKNRTTKRGWNSLLRFRHPDHYGNFDSWIGPNDILLIKQAPEKILKLRIFNIYIYLFKYYLVQLNRSWSNSIRTRKLFKSEHLNFPGKELNVTDITLNFFSCFLILSKTHNRMEINL